ncbi:hypothetical protein ACTMU2_27505 [Cupriavidus basilensis]
MTNTTFEEGMYATILDTAMIPAKIRLFLDFVASHVSGEALRFSAYGKSAKCQRPAGGLEMNAAVWARRAAQAGAAHTQHGAIQWAVR